MSIENMCLYESNGMENTIDNVRFAQYSKWRHVTGDLASLCTAL